MSVLDKEIGIGDLEKFLGSCREKVVNESKDIIVSITKRVEDIDPLCFYGDNEGGEAFYFQDSEKETSFAARGCEVRKEFEGKGIFEEEKAFLNDIIKSVIFFNENEESRENFVFCIANTFSGKSGDFPGGQIYLPRYSVGARRGACFFTANFEITSESDVGELVEECERTLCGLGDMAQEEGEIHAIIRKDESLAEREEHLARVGECLDLIEKGVCEKVVLARSVGVEAGRAFKPAGILKKLSEKFPFAYPCAVSNGEGDTFIACAPERLVKINKNKLETEALAGSIARGATEREDGELANELLNSEKDVNEHEYVTHYIREKLEGLGLCPEIGKPGIKKFPNVQHIHSRIEADLVGEVDFFDIAGRLHPTPAVAGVPLAEALEVIEQMEGFDRGLYAGAIGCVNCNGDGQLVVGLRSALINKNRATLYAGGGIVKGSSREKEFEETDIKLQAMLNNLV